MTVSFRNAYYVLIIGYGKKIPNQVDRFRIRIPTPHSRGTVGLLLLVYVRSFIGTFGASCRSGCQTGKRSDNSKRLGVGCRVYLAKTLGGIRNI